VLVSIFRSISIERLQIISILHVFAKVFSVNKQRVVIFKDNKHKILGMFNVRCTTVKIKMLPSLQCP